MGYKYFDKIMNDPEVDTLIAKAEECLRSMSYTEHGKRHLQIVSRTAEMILSELGYDERSQELARIAGYLHDVGNLINRHHHGITSACLVYPILMRLGLDYDEICTICSAIGNHEEQIGTPVNHISAALIIADKSDAHRTRVHRKEYDERDIHDRVNYAIYKNSVDVDPVARTISSRFYMNRNSSITEYLEIYMSRVIMCESAAKKLGCEYKLYINDMLINRPDN